MRWFRSSDSSSPINPKVKDAYIRASGDINNHIAAAVRDNTNILAAGFGNEGQQDARQVFSLLS